MGPGSKNQYNQIKEDTEQCNEEQHKSTVEHKEGTTERYLEINNRRQEVRSLEWKNIETF